jgi:hypothetical protein
VLGGITQMVTAAAATAPQYAVMPVCIATAPVTLKPVIAPIIADFAAASCPAFAGTPATDAPWKYVSQASAKFWMALASELVGFMLARPFASTDWTRAIRGQSGKRANQGAWAAPEAAGARAGTGWGAKD